MGWSKGGWNAANCKKFVKHTIKEMDDWIEHDNVLSGRMTELEVPNGYSAECFVNTTSTMSVLTFRRSLCLQRSSWTIGRSMMMAKSQQKIHAFSGTVKNVVLLH